MKTYKQFITELTASIGNIEEKEFIKRIAEFYQQSNEPTQYITASYTMLRNHVNLMYDKIINELKVKVIPSETDPYGSDKEMMSDIAQNKQLKVYTGHTNHPVFTPEENIKFRVVHDYYSHYTPNKGAFNGIGGFVGSIFGVSLRGHDFTFKGELQAYRAHTRFAGNLPQINAALFSEIVAQVAYYFHFKEFPDPQKIVDFTPLLNINKLDMSSFI